MPSTQEFRRRIKSVNNTKQITKAMEMIASIKMQKSVRMAQSARAYVQNAWNTLHRLATLTLPENHPLIFQREIKRTAVILITSDRGLCGSYNSEIIKKYSNFLRNVIPAKAGIQNNAAGSQIKSGMTEQSVDIIAIGKKGAEFVKRYQTGKLVAEFPGFENVAFESIVPIAKMTIEEYLAGNYDRIVIIYSHFESSLRQTPVVQQLLPIVEEHIDKNELWEKQGTIDTEFKFEPDADAVMDGILRQVLRTQIYGAVLEANASVYSAQMVAMKNATDNAGNLIDELKLIYNTVRQGNITREIAEISGAAEAMK